MRQKRVATLLAVFVAVSALASAQFLILDPAAFAQNASIAALRQTITTALGNEAEQLRQMARRLTAFSDFGQYRFQETPEWRIHLFLFEQYLFANEFTASLNYGDRRGAGFADVARERIEPGSELAASATLDPAAMDAIRAQLATLDLADSTIISGVDQDGQLRYNGRKELDAIEALQADVIDPSDDQSTAAVLDKVSGAGLIRAHQQQARIQFLAAIVEQMVVDNKRSRDTEVAVMNMRLLAMRDGRAAGGAVVAGAAEDLRTWRQP